MLNGRVVACTLIGLAICGMWIRVLVNDRARHEQLVEKYRTIDTLNRELDSLRRVKQNLLK